jgi:hypothetical protein
MAEAKLHLEIGPQYVEAAKKAVEDALVPFRNLDEYWIRSDGDDSGERWLSVGHAPCKREIYDSWKNDGPELNVAQVMQLIAAHHCEAPDA